MELGDSLDAGVYTPTSRVSLSSIRDKVVYTRAVDHRKYTKVTSGYRDKYNKWNITIVTTWWIYTCRSAL